MSVFRTYRFEWQTGLHLLLGIVVASFPAGVALWVLGWWLGALVQTVRTRNDGGIAGYAAIYLSSLELLARMSQSGLPHEFAKYGVGVLCLVGMLVERRQRPFAYPILLYFLCMLLPGMWMAAHFFGLAEAIDQISFNLSGPLCLCLATLYFYRRDFDFSTLARAMRLCLLPIVSALGFLSVKSPAISQISFTLSANFEASGGYGPNQVASVIGLGLLLLVFAFIFKIPLFKSRLVLYALLGLLTYRGLLTFSRGGMIAPLVVAGLMLLIYYYHHRTNLRRIGATLLSVLVLTAIAWVVFEQINTATGNRLYYRFSGERPTGVRIGLGKYSSGRLEIMMKDFSVFLENPLLGVGPGMGKYKRFEHGYRQLAAAHIEPSRMLSEHGLPGMLALAILLFFPMVEYFRRKIIIERLWLVMGVFFCLLFMTHSATRLAVPMLMYGLSFIKLDNGIPNQR